ncbi:hypothetical protein PBI_MRMAGOO_8 [Mycobacterium phage MrMagoo]|uniref:Uncharacterized protein n=1 Tax=Mycobacterium phage MrMagoo TaxID=1927020 RepID=A0A1L6BYE7_9CAUD|nr:hypothetical protein J4U04_gp008 [Mycobacterium phage MrMagoo]APQ42113.1 hypothetical protein PBI_MRMAGOO_8 [Mycobacterium phage MrMagoo]ARM70189.1 hypothetical protein SEA_GARDENSALSA_8 [Mycobacterium phage GardenSalsa]
MPVAPQAREVFLRMSIGHIHNSQDYLKRFIEMGPEEELEHAVEALDDAIQLIQNWAADREITIRTTMKT